MEHVCLLNSDGEGLLLTGAEMRGDELREDELSPMTHNIKFMIAERVAGERFNSIHAGYADERCGKRDTEQPTKFETLETLAEND